ncbi:hypothetical protein DM02DRAFT_699514 [Periconia macrospinosa]|uniref:Zn(2)-C6 fungal-type domain-containing protein n=1 Tax=Periconia macrospinosa TaxID=97972 RepID=A0A2V1D3A8_9PLEO|nr:hypothetical protein DM02DRAFT_699514 [Periconia macrospinosa]
MASSASSFPTHDPACDNCRQKKIRCDRGRPRCGNCRRACVACNFSGREKRGTSTRKRESTSDVEDRLMRLENSMYRISKAVETRLPPLVGTTSPLMTSLPLPTANPIPFDSVAPINTGYQYPEFPAHFDPLQISLYGQRFFYGSISVVTQCFGIHECLSKARPDYQYLQAFEDNLTKLKSLCRMLTYQGPVDVDFGSNLLKLPHQKRVEAAVELFLGQSSFPEIFFHPQILRSQISNLSSHNNSSTNMWHPTIPTDSSSSSSSPSSRIEAKDGRDLPTLFLLAAKSALAEGAMRKCRMVDIQALIAMTLVAIRSVDFFLAELALNRACTLAKQTGLHRDQFLGEEPVEAFEERQLVFWTLYTIDKSLSLTLQRNCALPTSECNTPLPSVLGPMGLAEASIPGVLARIQLGAIQEQIFSGLFSATAVRQNGAERQGHVQVLLDQLEVWKKGNDISTDKEHISGALTNDEKHGFLYAYHSHFIVIQSQSPLPQRADTLDHARKAVEYLCANSGDAAPLDKIPSSALLLVFQGEPLTALFTILKQVLSSTHPQESVADTWLLRHATAPPHQSSSPLTKMNEVIHTLATIGCNRWNTISLHSASSSASTTNNNHRGVRVPSGLTPPKSSNISATSTPPPPIPTTTATPIYDFQLLNMNSELPASTSSANLWNTDSSGTNYATAVGNTDLSWLLNEQTPPLHAQLDYATVDLPADSIVSMDSALGESL